jgi:gamma-glutamyl:cysteine ligase YbdK (ATP-grasp superfamily)
MRYPSFTIGIEEEYQIIDPATRELTSYVTRVLEEGRSILHERVKPEMRQSQIETAPPCKRRSGTPATTWSVCGKPSMRRLGERV